MIEKVALQPPPNHPDVYKYRLRGRLPELGFGWYFGGIPIGAFVATLLLVPFGLDQKFGWVVLTLSIGSVGGYFVGAALARRSYNGAMGELDRWEKEWDAHMSAVRVTIEPLETKERARPRYIVAARLGGSSVAVIFREGNELIGRSFPVETMELLDDESEDRCYFPSFCYNPNSNHTEAYASYGSKVALPLRLVIHSSSSEP